MNAKNRFNETMACKWSSVKTTKTAGIGKPVHPLKALRMAKRLKTVTIKPQMLSNRSLNDTQGPTIVRCKNLRLKGGRLVVAAMPGEINVNHAGQGLRFVTSAQHSLLGRLAFYKIGSDVLAYCRLDSDELLVRPIGVVKQDITAIMELSEQRLLMVTADAQLQLDIDTDRMTIKQYSPKKQFEEWSLTVEEHTPVTLNVAGRKLGKSYTAESRVLTATDASRFHADGIAAIDRHLAGEAQAGRFAQMVAGRYRLVDNEGKTLFVSLPKLLGPSSGFCLTGSASATLSADYSSYSDWTISAQSFSVVLSAPANATMAERAAVAEVRVELSPLIFPFTASSARSGEIRKRATGNRADEIVFNTCGAQANVDGGYLRLGPAIAEQLLGLGDRAFSTVLTISNPFNAESNSWRVSPPASVGGGVATQAKQLAEMLRQQPQSKECGIVSMPHTFGAQSVATLGSCLAMGNLTLNLFVGHKPSYWLATKPDAGTTHWDGESVITFADGSRVVAVETFTAAANLPPLSPMIYYPRPDAVEARITFRSAGGVNLSATMPLKRLNDDFGACAVNDHGTQLPLSATSSASLSPSTTKQINLPGAIVITERACEGDVLSATLTESSGRIVDLLEVDRRASAWESNRRRLYVATEGGLDGVSVSDNYTSQRWERLDPRGAANSPSLVATPGARYPVAALLGGDVTGIKSGTVTTVMDRAVAGQGAIGWDCVNNELWCSDPVNSSTTVIPSLGDFHYSFEGIDVARLISQEQGLLIASGDSRLYDTSAEAAYETPVEWQTCIAAPTGNFFTTARLSGVNAAILSSGKSPSLEITGAYEPMRDSETDAVTQLTPLTRIRYQRRSAMPTVVQSIIAPAMPYIVTTIKGTASANARIGDIALQFAEAAGD